jgi:hypothetical protein
MEEKPPPQRVGGFLFPAPEKAPIFRSEEKISVAPEKPL